MKTQNDKVVAKVIKVKEKLSLGELIQKNIPKDTFKGFSQLLEPHEIPNRK